MWMMRADEITKSGRIAPFPISYYRPELIPAQVRAQYQAYSGGGAPRNQALEALARTASIVAESFSRGEGARFVLPGTTKVIDALPGGPAQNGLAGVVTAAANLAARGQPVVISSQGAAALVMAARGTNRSRI